MAKRICLYPGSFDPMTIGHYNLIERASLLFDEVVVAVLMNSSKSGCFPMEKRLFFLKKACKPLKNVRVMAFEGLTVELAKKEKAGWILRGIRSVNDFSSEYPMACLNRRLAPECETVFLPSLPELSDVSSSAVRELASFHADYSSLVPALILQDIQNAFQEQRGNE